MDSTPDTFVSLFVAYAVIWGGLVVFLLRVQARQRQILKRLRELESRISS